MYWKAIQDSVFDGTIKLLRRHRVDTSQFEQTSQQIVNNGLMMTADNMTNTYNQQNAQFGGGFAAQGNAFGGNITNQQPPKPGA